MTDLSLQALADRLAELQTQGIDQQAPVRFAYLQALVQQAQSRNEPVSLRLQAKISQGLDAFPVQPHSACDAAQSPGSAHALRQLQHRLRGESEDVDSRHMMRSAPAPVTLKSVDVLRDTWVELKQTQRVTEAICQPPENAGPLNSHHLVIRSLETLRSVSPAYLAQFMDYVDTVLLLQPAPVHESARARKSAESKPKAKARKR